MLLVKLKHIGDALLLTPAITAIRRDYPRAEIWVVVRSGTEGILAGCPAIDRLLTVAPIDAKERTLRGAFGNLRLLLQLRRRKFDYAFELTDGDRGRFLAGLSGARHRCANASFYPLNRWWRLWFNCVSDTEWTAGHRVEKDHSHVNDFLPLSGEIPPLCFDRSQTRTPDSLGELDDFVVIHPGTRWRKKRWPKEHWLELGRQLLKRTGKVVVSCGPDAAERRLAKELIEELGADRVVSADGKLNWRQLAHCLYHARAFVGVDTAAMHLAAACQCPTVAIWAWSVVEQWRPWKAPHELINLAAGRDRSEWPAARIMEAQTPDMALAAVDRILRPAPASR